MKLKIESNMMGARQLFKDVEKMQMLEQQAQKMINEIGNYEQKLYKDWKQRTLKSISDKREQFEMTGQLMEFDHEAGDLLRVNYSESLVTLVKDGRAIGELGFKVDDKIQEIIERAKKFYKEGVCLK